MRISFVITLVLVVAGAGCAGGTGRDKAGTRPVVLTLRVADRSSSTTDQIARAFQARVEEASGGAIRVKVSATTNAELPADYGEQVIEAVRKGNADLVAVSSRAWSGAGVSSLEPLDAPLLIESDAALDAVAKDAVAGEMLAGIRQVGMEPLALVPDGLRLLYGYRHPLLSVADLRDARVKLAPSRIGYAALTALGARPVWIGGFAFQDQAKAGAVAGSVTTPDPAVQVAPGTYTANAPMAAGAVTLAVAGEGWKKLDRSARQLVERAAVETRDAWALSRLRVAQAATETCATGATIAGIGVAAAPALTAMRAAVAPVYAAMERDAATAGRLDRIRKLSAAMPPAAVAVCPLSAPVTTGASLPRSGDQAAIDGVWRKMVSRAEWARAGLSPIQWTTNGGLHTLTFHAGTWLDHDEVEGNPPDGGGTFTLDGDVVRTLEEFPSPGQVVFEARFVRHGNRLVLKVLKGDEIGPTVWGGTWKLAG